MCNILHNCRNGRFKKRANLQLQNWEFDTVIILRSTLQKNLKNKQYK